MLLGLQQTIYPLIGIFSHFRMVQYASKVRVGLSRVSSLGDGYTINLQWFQAYLTIQTNKIAYHIYYTTDSKRLLKDSEYPDVFHEGVKLVVIDGSLEVNVISLTPGQEYWFCVRAVEYDPTIFDLSLLPVAYDNVRFYPSSLLRQNMAATDLIVPLMDVEGFTPTGVVKVGIELIQYLAIDTVNSNLVIESATNPTGGHLVLQSNDLYYLPASTNVGVGTINSLTLIQGAANQIWNIRCIWVQRDASNNPIVGTAKFEAIGSITGPPVDGYGNFFTWTVNDSMVVSNGYLSFSITETSTFSPGDNFTVQVAGVVPGVSGGRGYNMTPITSHYINGFDGYNYYNPLVFQFTLTEATLYDQMYACTSRFEYPNFPFTIIDGYKQVVVDYLSTDDSAADAANVTFPMYDYCGYHRTDPVQLLNGTCVGTYIGGQVGGIDANGNYNLYSGLSLQEQNTQREDVLLSVTGQPAVLIKRQQTGNTCSCYLSTSEYPDDRCPFCFAKGTLVRSEKGLVGIETINIGDKILSADGKYHVVTEVFKRPFSGKLKSITTTTTTSPILTTADHPFLMLETDHKTKNSCGPNSNCKEYIKRGDGQSSMEDIIQLPSGRWHARVKVKNHDRIVLGTFDTKDLGIAAIREYKDIHSKPSHRLEWRSANNIDKNGWLVSKWNKTIIDMDKIQIPKAFLKTTKLGMERIGNEEFLVDEEFLWIIGMYIAEGSNSKRSIAFSLHENEIAYQNKIIGFFRKYGFNPKLRVGETRGVVVEVSGTSLANWFPQLCGKLCHNKHIPEEFMSLPDSKLLSIIQGIWDGDGTKRENEIIQTSEILCLQIAELLHRLNKQPLITRVKNGALTKNGNKRKQAYRVNWEEKAATHKNRKGRWAFYEQLLTKVKKVEEIDYDGYVYNLEVEGDHTYVVQNILVHNCYGTKFVFGYDQYFNPRSSDGRIQVRLGPTAENLKMQEAGLESTFPLDMWTLTVPTIKTRDIIVIFDQDDNESFRYEVGDVVRNNTILGQDGGQHLKTFRVRKTDPAYQFRIFRNTAEFPNTLNTTLGFTPGIPPHSHTVVVNENVLAVSQINQTTGISQGHNHPIINGQVMEVLGHFHTILLP